MAQVAEVVQMVDWLPEQAQVAEVAQLVELERVVSVEVKFQD